MSIVFNKSKEISLDDETLRSDLLKIASGMDNVIALGRGDPDFHTPRHIVEAAKKFTEHSLDAQVSTEPKLYLDEKLINDVKKKYSFSKEFKHICVGLSASGPTKRWDIEKFISTFTKISEEIPCKFYLAGGKNDLTLIKEFKNTSLGWKGVQFSKV